MSERTHNEVVREVNKRKNKNQFLNTYNREIISLVNINIPEKKARKALEKINRELKQLGHQTEMVNARKLATMAYLSRFEGDK